MSAVQAQSSSRSSSSYCWMTNLAQNQTQNQAPDAAAANFLGKTRARSACRSASACAARRPHHRHHDAYDHRWNWGRWTPSPPVLACSGGGKPLQRRTGWRTGDHLRPTWNMSGTGRRWTAAATAGTKRTGPNFTNDTRYAISQYDVLGGPDYRFYLQPKFSISGRAMAGWAYGNFGGDTNGIPPKLIGLYPNSSTFGASVSVIGEFNVSPNTSFVCSDDAHHQRLDPYRPAADSRAGWSTGGESSRTVVGSRFTVHSSHWSVVNTGREQAREVCLRICRDKTSIVS